MSSESLSCDRGCEYAAGQGGLPEQTGRTCHALPTFPDPFKNTCCTGDAAVTAGNPVNFNTGAKIATAVDFTAGSGRLEFSRIHSSGWRVTLLTEMGSTWQHTYMRKIATVDSDTVKVMRHSGEVYVFRKYGGAWMRDPDVPYTLEEMTSGGVLSGWVLRAPDDSDEFFDADGKLIAVDWGDGDSLALEYTGGQLTKVVDAHGRALLLGYTNGVVTSVATPDGSTLVYTYDTAMRITKVEINDGVSTSQIARYSYTSASYTKALTQRWDENNAIYGTWTYGSNGRVSRSVHGNPAGKIDELTFTYGTGTATVTDALGAQTTIGSTVIYGRARSTGADKICPSCNGKVFAAQTLDVNGYADTQVDFNGVLADLDFNPRGLLVKRVDSANEPDFKRTTETAWHSMFRKPVQRDVRDASGGLLTRQTFTYNSRGQSLHSTRWDANLTNGRAQTTAYCEPADIAANLCPLEGLVRAVDGPLPGIVDRTNFEYYPADEASCASAPSTCPYRKGDLWKVTNPLGHLVETLKYDGAGRVLSSRDANGVVTDRQYHARGWLTAVKVRGTDDAVETDDAITRIEYWPTGLVKRVTQPDGAYTQFTYDQAHRLTDVTDNGGNFIHYTLDFNGNRIKEDTKNSSGVLKRTLSRVFNQLGQLTTLADAQANPTDFTYDANGHSNTVTDALSRVTDSDYDPLNRLSRTLQDVGGIEAETKLAYGPLDNLTKVTDPKGLDTIYTYNGLGDLTQLSSPDTGVTTYTYDAAGNRATQTDARGIASTYSYDALGRISAISYPTSSLNVGYVYDTTQAACIAGETYSIGRTTRMDDASGNTQYCYNRLGQLVRKVQTTNGIPFTVRYAWDKAGQLIGMVYPDGSEVDYTRNALGQITAMGITRPGQAREVLVSQVTYLPFGPTAGWTFGNGRVMTRSYDQDYRPTAILDSAPGGLSLGFGYDVVGNLTKLGTVAGITSPAITFGYDTLGRLTRSEDGPTAVAIDAYSYDATGNRLSHSTATGTSAYTYPSGNHHLTYVGGTARGYDAVGNTTNIGSGREFVYSDANRLSQVKNGGTVAMNYTYNGRGEQVRRHLGSTNSYTIYDESGHWLGDYDSSGVALQQALWMDELPVGLIANGGQLHYIEPDHLGSPRVVIEVARNVAVWRWDLKGEAFGATTAEEDVDGDSVPLVLDMRFPGQRYDRHSALNQNYFRDYEPSTARYIQSDPIGLIAGTSTYTYIESNPLINYDLLGLAGGMDSPNATLRSAIARGDVRQLEAIMESLAPAEQQLAKEAIRKFNSRAADWISRECRGSINREFPSQFRDKTLKEILELSKSGDSMAKKAWKLLNDSRFRK
ncbi:RHS repeat-associated core domain-containing protein [Pseudoxanthomonas indica]|nr:RHS repeat-associated core domain-containing protein [Pseudoxanthomonas indica]